MTFKNKKRPQRTTNGIFLEMGTKNGQFFYGLKTNIYLFAVIKTYSTLHFTFNNFLIISLFWEIIF